ncbi:hypothetical protein Agub_g4651 [Astrephomene gubernaculifera]|uniref:Suppressor of white apricot N-terminal domain-containing protein n=1 Tax=Astrephomene gubernaculifera TaxID=47775 RepID=A0AAD3DL24_9CHLO|nr:hypothetical protein Agub_g4651 [Astrephomene gubernaculifera]
MASYYHDARAHARKLKEMSEDNKRRAERKAEIAETQVEHPLNYLFVEGRACRTHRNTEQHQNLESGAGLIPWGNGGSLIDRFDGRALLDFYREPDPSAWSRPKSAQEEKLDQSLRFESFRDVVRLTAKGLGEEEGLAFARQENIEIRAAMRAAATAAAVAAAGQRNPQSLSMAATAGAGTGMFSAVGFNYGGGQAGAGGAAGDSSSSDSDSDAESEQGDEGDVDARQEAEDDRIDDIAELYGLTDFSYRLHRAQEQEGEEEARLRKPPRRRGSRKNAKERARRMKGMGLDPTGVPIGPARDWTQPPPPRSSAQDTRLLPPPPRSARDALDEGGHRRSSPTYYGSRRSRSKSRSRSRSPSRSRSRSPRRRHRTSSRPQFITEFSSSAAADSRAGASGRGGPSGVAALAAQQQQLAVNRPNIDRSVFERDEAILDALPDMPDPAALGAQPIPVPPTSVQAIRAAAENRSQRGGSGSGRRERERDERERERERERDYHGYSYRRRYEQPHAGSRSRSRSRSRERDRERDRSHGGSGAIEGDRARERPRWGGAASTSAPGAGAANGKVPVPHPSASAPSTARAALPGTSATAAGGGSTPAGAAGAAAASIPASAAGSASVKETPQERLKRIMAAQLNKQAQKDHLVAAQRKLQVEKEKEARQAFERVVMRRSPSPPPREGSEHESYRRGRSRSRSPRGGGSHRRRSRSR